MALDLAAGTIASPSSTGNQTYSGLGMTPKCLILGGGFRTAASAAVNDYCNFGLGVSSSSRAAVGGFEVDVGEEAVGCGFNESNRDGSSDSLYMIRFRQGPIIATVHVAGQADLVPEEGEPAVIELAERVSQKITAGLDLASWR